MKRNIIFLFCLLTIFLLLVPVPLLRPQANSTSSADLPILKTFSTDSFSQQAGDSYVWEATVDKAQANATLGHRTKFVITTTNTSNYMGSIWDLLWGIAYINTPANRNWIPSSPFEQITSAYNSSNGWLIVYLPFFIPHNETAVNATFHSAGGFENINWISGPNGYDGIMEAWNGSSTGDLHETKIAYIYNINGVVQCMQTYNGTGSAWDLISEMILVSFLPKPTLHPLTIIGNTVYLSWNATANATTYYLYRDTSPITQTSISGLTPISQNSTTATQDVPPTGNYFYAVVAGNSVDISTISNCEQISVPPATPSLISVTHEENLVMLNWTNVPGTTNYYIYRNTSNITNVTGSLPVAVVATPLLSYQELVNYSEAYYYVVVAGSAFGNSTISNCMQINIPPPQPSLLLVSWNIAFGNVVNLNWTAVPGASSYYIYRSTTNITNVTGLVPVGTVLAPLLSYGDILELSGNYSYVVVAGNTLGNSSISNCMQITVYPLPITDLEVLAVGYTSGYENYATITLMWYRFGSPPYASRWYIYRSTSPITNLAGLTPLSDTNLSGGFTDKVYESGRYYYVVVAGTDWLNSTISNCISADVDIPPQVPGFDLVFCLLPLTILSLVAIVNRIRKRL